MKKTLSYLLAVGMTAFVTYYFTARHFAARNAALLASESERWQAEKARLSLALDQAHRRGASGIAGTGLPGGGRPLPHPARHASAPPSSFLPREAGLPVPGAESPAAAEAVPPLVAPMPVPPATLVWARYEQTLPGQGSKCRIEGTLDYEGTSTLHDWSMETPIIAGFFEVDARVRFDAGQTPPELGAGAGLPARAEVRIPVRTLKSFNAKMDQVYREHMDESLYRNIEFRLAQLTWAPREAKAETSPRFAAEGELVIHGVTNAGTLPITIQRVDSDQLRISGRAPLKMTAFGVQPPAPILDGAAFQAGDGITVTFDWVVKRVGESPPKAATAER